MDTKQQGRRRRAAAAAALRLCSGGVDLSAYEAQFDVGCAEHWRAYATAEEHAARPLTVIAANLPALSNTLAVNAFALRGPDA
jgi:hypothetical protein